MCHVDFAQSGLWQPAYRVPQASIECNLLSTLGSYGVQALSEGVPIERTGPNGSKRQSGGVDLAFKANYVWFLVVQGPKREGRPVTS